MERKGKLKMGTVVLVILGVIVVGLGGAVLFTSGERLEIKNLPLAAVNFKELKNGTFVGKYEGSKSKLRDATVQVTVSSGAVTDIKPLKGALDANGQPVEMAKGLTINDLYGRVIQSQSLQVDTISGATLTSKTHLKALENALEQARTK